MKRKLFIFILGVLCLIAPLSLTLAYQTDSDQKLNAFIIGSNTTSIVEEFEKPTVLKPGMSFQKNVKIHNSEGSDCYIRVFIALNNQDASPYVSMDINTTDWTKKSDGYYYYNPVLKVNETSSSLMTTVTVSSSAPQSVLEDLEIIVYEESVQATAGNAQKAFESIR